MTIYETRTGLSPAEVLERAVTFLTTGSGPQGATLERRGPGFVRLYIEVGEMLIAASRDGDATRVRGSASRGANLLARFLTTLGPPLDVSRTVHRRGRCEGSAARHASFTGGESAGATTEPPRATRAA